MGYSTEQTNTDVVTLRHTVTPDWRQRYLLLADVHFDSPHCNRKLLRRYLDQAVECDAGVMVFGDWFDAMQGRDDKRSSKSDLMTAHKATSYINELIDDSAEFLAPYAEHLVFLALGNHETGILKHLEVDILLLLAGTLNTVRMGYSGWVRFMFQREAGSGTTGHRTKKKLYYHHGSGGGGEVTKGVMRAQREAAWVGDADIYVGSHVHEQWLVYAERLRLADSGRVYRDTTAHVCLGTFKDEYVMAGGFHVERERPPKPQGAYWLEFRYSKSAPGEVTFDLYRGGG